MSPKTLYDKIWDDHFVTNRDDGSSLIYIDRHLVHEVTSPQAFDGLRENNLFRVNSSKVLFDCKTSINSYISRSIACI